MGLLAQLKYAQENNKAFQLITGVIGIYISYILTGIVHQFMITQNYKNDWTGEEERYLWPAGFIIFPYAMVWIIGQIFNRYQIDHHQRTYIPEFNAAICGLWVTVSTLTYTYAVYLTNYPIVMMFKSCNILSVILVGVMCSRVTDRQLKLGPKKIVVGVFVTIGIIIFKYFDPSTKKQKATQFLGILLLIVSIISDGLLPDFQAEIKAVYKPQPMEMMAIVNKWSVLICIAYSLCLWELHTICSFLATHYLCLFHMFLMGVLALTGQMFVYRMIKQFKQHFVPFAITTRKIFTAALSIVFYNHPTNFGQIMGIIIVFGIVTYEFVSDLVAPSVPHGHHGSETGLQTQRPNDFNLETENENPQSPPQEMSMSNEIDQSEEQVYKNRMHGEHAQHHNVLRPAFQAVEQQPQNPPASPEAQADLIEIKNEESE